MIKARRPKMEVHGGDLTVIIPSFNMQDMTERAITSVLENNAEISILIVDDASDPPITLPAHLNDHSNIEVIRHAENLGASSARNTGIKHSRTEWISFLDADDLLLPDTFEKRLAFVNAQISLQRKSTEFIEHMIFGCGWLEQAPRSSDSRIRIPRPADSLEEFASGCWYCPGSTIIAHRRVFDGESKGYSKTLRRLEDFEWGLRFAAEGGRLIVQQEAGVAIKPSNRVNFSDIKTAAKKIILLHSRLETEYPTAWRSLHAYLELEKATSAWRDGSRIQALSALLISYWHKPRLGRHLSPGWIYRATKP